MDIDTIPVSQRTPRVEVEVGAVDHEAVDMEKEACGLRVPKDLLDFFTVHDVRSNPHLKGVI